MEMFKLASMNQRQKSIAPLDRFSLSLEYYLNEIDVDKYALWTKEIQDVTISDIKRVAHYYKQMTEGHFDIVG